jgi:glutamine synthetase adenylyltransferase
MDAREIPQGLRQFEGQYVQQRAAHDPAARGPEEGAARQCSAFTDQVLDAAKKRIPGLSRTAVFRVLGMLVSRRMIRRLPYGVHPVNEISYCRRIP